MCTGRKRVCTVHTYTYVTAFSSITPIVFFPAKVTITVSAAPTPISRSSVEKLMNFNFTTFLSVAFRRFINMTTALGGTFPDSSANALAADSSLVGRFVLYSQEMSKRDRIRTRSYYR